MCKPVPHLFHIISVAQASIVVYIGTLIPITFHSSTINVCSEGYTKGKILCNVLAL